MSHDSLVSEILMQAGVGRPANVTAARVRHREAGKVEFALWQAAPWVMGGIIAILLAGLAIMIRKEVLYASVGRSTCGTIALMDKPEYRQLWVVPDERAGIVVPAPDVKKIKACEAADRLF